MTRGVARRRTLLGMSLVALIATTGTPTRRCGAATPPIGAPGAALDSVASPESPDPLDPPATQDDLGPTSDEPEGVDVIEATDDSLPEGDVELGIGADGSGGAAHRRRRVRFSDSSMRGDWRSGDDDPLSGGAIEAGVRGGRFSVGHVSPRWGRGLVLGRADDPWRASLAGRAGSMSLALPRARTVDGAGFRRKGRVSIESAVGRLGHERIVAARGGIGRWSLGIVERSRAPWLVSLSVAERTLAIELAAATDRRWRAEAVREDPSAIVAWRARVRAGSVGFRPPGSPADPGPPQALALELAGSLARWRWQMIGALWRLRPGASGARGALEVRREMAHHKVFAMGAEEQHGTQRAAPAGVVGLRQAGWVEWRAGDGPLRIGVRDEVWGRRPLARDAVRSVASAWLGFAARGGLTMTLARSEYRVARGEHLVLPEAGGDRLWLRAMSGAGSHTRLELGCPALGGRVRATVTRIETSGGSVRPHWSVDWTKRARTRSDHNRGGP